MLTAQSCARRSSAGSAEAPSSGGAQHLAGMGCMAFQGRSAQGLEGRLTISPIPAGSGWHHLQLSEPCQRWRAADACSAALDLLWGEVSWLRRWSQKIHQAPGLHDANPAHGRGIHANVLPTERSRGTKLLACCHPTWQSCSQASTARDRGGGRWDGKWGGHDQPWLQHLHEHGPFYSSLCWPLHVQPYVSHVITKAILTGRIIFIFLIQQPANSLWLGDAKNGSHFLHLAK